MDRDPPNGQESWKVMIKANDNYNQYRTQHATTIVDIEVEDVNDNAPFLDMVSEHLYSIQQEGLRLCM